MKRRDFIKASVVGGAAAATLATPAIAQHIYGLPHADSSSAAYQNAGDWIGILFGVYQGNFLLQ